MRIGVLGPLTVEADGVALAPRDRVVLAALVVGHGSTVAAEALADALWHADEPPASWAKVVQGCIVRLRRAVGASAIQTDAKGYRLVAAPDDIDARRFEMLVARGREQLTLGESDRAMYTADEALSLWRGRALVELEEWEPGRIEAARLGELRLDAEELRVDAALAAGRHREVLADASAAAARAPLREHRWVQLALAQHRVGRQGDALRTLHEARRLLVRELGVDPGEEIVALESAILCQDPSLVAPRFVVPSDVCPFRGLAPYETGDAEIYFGRAAELRECLDRVRRAGVLAVVGPSGSGKSSLLRAGLVPALQRDGYRVHVVTPGLHPMRSLDAIPPRRGADPLAVVVDQCEEAVTMCADPDERRRFFDTLSAHATQGLLLVGFRADRLGQLSQYPPFAALVERGLYLLKAMTSAQLQEAIEAPARQAGLLLEPGLVDLLVRDVEDEPGSLPLVSHALYQTWQAREGNTLTVAGYRAVGGVRGAVSQSAEALYERAGPEQQRMLRGLVLRLVTPTPDGEAVRARVPRRLVAPDADRERLLDSLVDARLVTTDAQGDGASVQLAHEALVRAWPRLRDWLDEDAEGQRIGRHLTEAADNWDTTGRPESELYRGVRLARAADWRENVASDLHPTEREFLDASQQLADAELAAVEQRARHQMRVNRRLRALVGGVAAFAAIAAAGGVVAMRQADRADRAAERARSQELATAAIGAIDADPSLAKLLAFTAVDLEEPTPPIVAALHEAYAADPVVARWGFVGEVGVVTADIDPAGSRIAASGILQPDGAGWTVSVADVESGATVWSVDLSEQREASAAVAEPLFTSDGRYVVAGVYWDPYSWRRSPVAFDDVDEPNPAVLGAHVFDASTGEVVDRIDLGRCGGVVSGVSDAHLLVRTLHGDPDVVRRCAWREGSVGIELIDRADGSRTVLTADTGVPWHLGAAMSRDGSVVAYDDGAAGQVVVIDVASGDVTLRLPTTMVRDLDSSGERLLVGWHDAQVWDLRSGRALATFDAAGSGPVADSRFGPGGRTVLSSRDDGTLRVWDAATGSEVVSYPGLGSGPIHVNDLGRATVTDPDQQMVAVLDTARRAELGAIDLCSAQVDDAAIVAVGSVAVVHSACGGDSVASLHVVDLQTGVVTDVDRSRSVAALAVSPDGTRFVDQYLAASTDGGAVAGPPVVSAVDSGAPEFELEALPTGGSWWTATSLRWSPDGRWIVGALGPHLVVWDAIGGRLVHAATLDDEEFAYVDAIVDPSSEVIVASASDRTLRRRSLRAWDDETVVATSINGAHSIGFAGFTEDRNTLVGVGGFRSGSSALAWFDTDTLVYRRILPTVHEGAITATATSPDGTWLVTTATDGSIRVWDTASGALVHDAGRRTGPVRGVAFETDRQIVVAADTGLERLTVDPDRLIELVKGSLTRGFTESECSRFNFADACPTLAELQQRPIDAGVPTGSFRVAWTEHEFAAEVVGRLQSWYDAPLWDETAEGAASMAADFAGVYTLEIGDRRFDLHRAGADESVCTGSVAINGDRLLLQAERGSFCYPSVLFEGDLQDVDGGLRFALDGFRAEYPTWILFGSRPLERVD